MTIKRKLVFVGAVVLILILALTCAIKQCAWCCNSSRADSNIASLKGLHSLRTNVTLAVFTVEPPVKVPLIYQEGDLLMELEQYPWLKALLFGRTGIEAFIPKEEWGDYTAYGWSKRMDEEFSNRRAHIEEVTREGQIWEGAHRQLSQVVLCVLDGERYLQINLDCWGKNGERLSHAQSNLKFIDGKWKRFVSNDSGMTMLLLLQCHADALKLVAEGKLQVNPIKELR